MKDAWKRKDLEKLMELAEYTPEERKELEIQMDKYDIK